MRATHDRTRHDADVTDRLAAWQATQAAPVQVTDEQRRTLETFQLAFAAVIMDTLAGQIDEDEGGRWCKALTTGFFATAVALGMDRMYAAVSALQARAQAGELARAEDADTDDPAFLAWAHDNGMHYTHAWVLGYAAAIKDDWADTPTV